jgi:hypothetical protein
LTSISTLVFTSAFCARILNIAYEFPISGVNSFGAGVEMVSDNNYSRLVSTTAIALRHK